MIRTVVLDWGDTVMRNLPYAGPMAHWPRVEAVPGIQAALAALAGRYRLVLATNAADSGATLVREALARVGLEDRFDAVLTARELGVRKPDPAFFQAVLRESGVAPGEAITVGDDYATDVAGPKALGMRAVWFNPARLPCPAPQPLQDAELLTMAELPDALGRCERVPDVAECLALLAAQDAPPQLVAHAQAVAAVAYRLACRLRGLGYPVDPLLAHRGGLLHDLAKITARPLGRDHGQLAAELLHAQGLRELAAIAERHMMFTLLEPASGPATWEEKLVHYVDKIVEGERVVSLDERLAALYRRYPENAERMRGCLPALRALEAEICASLGTTPDLLLADCGGTHLKAEPASHHADMTIPDSHWAVLRTLCTRLEREPIAWAVTGSVGLALQGVPCAVHDVDVQAGPDDIYALARCFAESIVQPVHWRASEAIGSHFGVLEIDGIKVELMGGLQKRLPSGEWEPPVDVAALRHTVEVRGLRIPVLPLEHEYRAYVVMGRSAKAALIRETITRLARGGA